MQEITKPEFKEEIKAELKGITQIEDNIEKVKEYALSLKEYYQDITFTEDTKKQAEEQKADINKQKKQVADFRKQIIARYNEPIKLFEETAKETEKILGETYDYINEQVKEFDKKELSIVKEKLENYFNEYAESKEIDFVKFDDMDLVITKGLLTSTGNISKKIQEQINNYLDSIRNDLDLIKTLEFKEEILIEYKKTLLCASSIANVQERHRQLEEMKKEPLTDETVQEKITHLAAPIEEEKIFEMTFKVRATKTKLKELKEFLDRGEYEYE